MDVKARDQGRRQYQIEIQLLNVTGLPGRIAYGWAELYRSQLQKGDGYDQLKPAYSIWLLGEALWPKRDEALHRFRLRDEAHLPAWMQTEEMKQAMSTLQGFSDQERAYHRYQARQDYLRQQKSIENRMRALLAEAEQARTEKEQARAAEERERAEKEAALAEIARLKTLLQVRGEE